MLPRDLEKHVAGAEALLAACAASPALLDEPELSFLKDFCESYPPSAAPAAAPSGGGDEPPPPSVPANAAEAPEDADWCAAGEKKSAAAAAAAGGDLAAALALYSEALELEAATACLSATTLAKRGEVLLKLERPRGCASDCAAALALNPDSCKALKVRGKAHAALGDYTAANLDLSKAQSIDFDPDLAELAKDVKDKAAAEATKKVAARNAEELEKRKKAAAAKREREQAAAAAQAKASAPGGMPGMGGMGGMPGAAPAPRGFGRGPFFESERSETDRAPFLGMGGMPPGAAGMMNDPDVAAAMQNPKVMAALQDMMAGGAPNPAKMMQYMQDPEIGPVLQKMMGAAQGMGMGGGMPGGMGGMPGGFGGMPGGMPGGFPGGGGGGFAQDMPEEVSDDDVPDLEEVDEVD